ncbi:TPA: hypothetical protein OWX15_002702 [Staphylococcus aureus]|uniref:hypothetical protein n=1 Tax=Staphylococcus TaxID=1279 RepID=UPI000B7E7B20|nr:hypothetical protein [Staphylococcus aureus]HCV9176800.1 hypothetical protein [Staphylococcus aureus]HCV9485297.1 hypothetical protein [Staphylococcus aureus]HDA2604644.1 hypothetical protein [Staphylococcus aureus]HDE0229986.1 hypothetical protein [Staphylococcus aureus]HEE8759956.1 hypothetical protein [Staphylococcus aureus]
MKITFEKDTTEEKAEKKAERRAKRKEKYGHLGQAQDGSLVKFISDKFKGKKNTNKKFFDDSKDFDFLKESQEGSAVRYVKNLRDRMFPKNQKKTNNKK